ncbi:MAG: preprotein translocase subunit SecG [Xanthomonadales bacterium]
MQVLNIFHVLIAIALVVFVLIQKGQGATAGAAFGSGASGTVFGARGAGNFLSRTTWVLAALFCAISLTMAIMVSRMMSDTEVGLGVVASDQAPAAIEVPVGEESPPAELSVGADEPAPVDLPALDVSAEESAPAADVPAVDDGQETGPDNG